MESLSTVYMATLMSETKIKVCKKLWTDRKTIEFIQVIETPSQKCKNSNLKLDKVSFGYWGKSKILNSQMVFLWNLLLRQSYILKCDRCKFSLL